MSWKYPRYPGKRYRFDRGDFTVVDTTPFVRHKVKTRCLARVVRIDDGHVLTYVVRIECPAHKFTLETKMGHPQGTFGIRVYETDMEELA